MPCYYSSAITSELAATVLPGGMVLKAKAYGTAASGSCPTQSWVPVTQTLRSQNLSLNVPEMLLSSMTALNINWEAEGSEAPNETARAKALLVLDIAELLEFAPTYVTASADGGVAVCFKNHEVYADVECFNSGEVWAVLVDRVNSPTTWRIEENRSSIAEGLRKIRDFLSPNV